MNRIKIRKILGVLLIALGAWPAFAIAGPSEVKLDRDYLSNLLARLPNTPFENKGQYRGEVNTFQLVGIDAKTRQITISCNVVGEFDENAVVAALKGGNQAKPPAPVMNPARAHAAPVVSAPTPATGQAWRKFRFEVRVSINIEPSVEGAPRLKFHVDDVKRKELTGIVGPLAKLMGRGFDQIVTTFADKKAAGLNDKLNTEVVKRVALFQSYGMLCGVDYFPTHLVLLFDVTRWRSEGIAGYVFTTNEPGTMPLYRWVNPRKGDHFYTTSSHEPDPRNYHCEGVACYVLPAAGQGTVPLLRFRGKNECFYTTAKNVEALKKVGYHLEGISCYLLANQQGNAVPLYRFLDPARGLHFYTIHPQAEFAK